MKHIILIFLASVISMAAYSQDKKEIVSYHFEYGFGLSDFYTIPQRFEQDKIMPFPVLDEYMVGIKIKKRDFKIIPMVGIVEMETYERKMAYKPSMGVVIKKRNLRLKISNGGMSFVIEF